MLMKSSYTNEWLDTSNTGVMCLNFCWLLMFYFLHRIQQKDPTTCNTNQRRDPVWKATIVTPARKVNQTQRILVTIRGMLRFLIQYINEVLSHQTPSYCRQRGSSNFALHIIPLCPKLEVCLLIDDMLLSQQHDFVWSASNSPIWQGNEATRWFILPNLVCQWQTLLSTAWVNHHKSLFY